MSAIPVKKERRTYLISSVLGLARETLGTVGQHTNPVQRRLIEENGLKADTSIYISQIAMGFDPEPFGIAHVYNRVPYTNPAYILASLKTAVSDGWLVIDRDGVYRPTERTRNFHAEFCSSMGNVLSKLSALQRDRLVWMSNLLRRIVDSIHKSTRLTYKPSFELDTKLACSLPSPLQMVCAGLSHIVAFREDTYVNAWMDQEVNSYVWETFSCVYKETARTASKIARKLGPCRHYDEAVYASALQELVGRGWIEEVRGRFEPTGMGLQVLAKVAHTMNRYFFEPWDEFDDVEIRELRETLEELLQKLQETTQKSTKMPLNVGRSIETQSYQWAGFSK